MDILPLAGLISYAGLTVYIANQVELARVLAGNVSAVEGQVRLLRWLSYGTLLLLVVFGMTVWQASQLSELSPDLATGLSPDDLPQVDPVAGMVTFVIAAGMAFFGYRLLSNAGFRDRVQNGLARLGGHFDAQSVVHITAVLLTLLLIVGTIGLFVLQGGIAGVAESLRENSIDVSDTLFTTALEVLFTLLGVGFAIRRSVADTLARLGLRWPTRQDLIWGLAVGIVGVFAVSLVLNFWAALTSPETFAAQTEAVEALDAAVGSLPLAFLIAITAAVGEEIWIRGGLQPVFGSCSAAPCSPCCTRRPC